jgi:hypothetical protein
MPSYDFAVVIAAGKVSEKKILDVTDALGEAGCTDASVRGHAEGMELLFARSARSLQSAISSTINDIEAAGFRVKRVEMQREAIAT